MIIAEYAAVITAVVLIVMVLLMGQLNMIIAVPALVVIQVQQPAFRIALVMGVEVLLKIIEEYVIQILKMIVQ